LWLARIKNSEKKNCITKSQLWWVEKNDNFFILFSAFMGYFESFKLSLEINLIFSTSWKKVHCHYVTYARLSYSLVKLYKGKSLRYSTWIGRGFFKMLQISLFGVSINIIGHVFFIFAQTFFCVDLWRFGFFCTTPWIYTKKSKSAHSLCICGPIFTFLDIF
jgi:hypothetical protein